MEGMQTTNPAPLMNAPGIADRGLKALAVDYDGTIAENGRISANTEAALQSLREAGFRLILVSGRRLENIQRVCDVLPLFDAVILENGALAYCPLTHDQRLLAPPVDQDFLTELSGELPEQPLFVGQAMIATAAANARKVEAVIERGGYPLAIVGCGPKIMVLPTGVDKRSGLAAALADLRLRPDEVVAVGDEENDIDLFAGCGLTAAVGNAAPSLKAAADLVLKGDAGQGVCQLIDMLIAPRT